MNIEEKTLLRRNFCAALWHGVFRGRRAAAAFCRPFNRATLAQNAFD
ncbi:MAG: hypothetical protein H8D74_01005 [Chloroflexi bacterium]|nr:hypothetical protein [Chloroflexota bacterium]